MAIKKAQITKLASAIADAKNILIMQPEIVDGDSLASSLALETIFTKMGKTPFMYSAVSVPQHLQYLSGWDRLLNELPDLFDMTILVDAARTSLIDKSLRKYQSRIAKKPFYIIDHHDSEIDLPFEHSALVNSKAVSTGEIIYDIAKSANWPIDKLTADYLATSILYDSLGLMTENTTAHSIHVVAELVEAGALLVELDEKRRETMKRDADLTAYKGQLLSRIEYALDGKLAYITVPWEEIELYSARYNPAMLVLDDMRMTKGVIVAVVFKTYPDGKLTAKLRANYGYPIAKKIAEHFGGGGHPYASGFKLIPGNQQTALKTLITATQKILKS